MTWPTLLLMKKWIALIAFPEWEYFTTWSYETAWIHTPWSPQDNKTPEHSRGGGVELWEWGKGGMLNWWLGRQSLSRSEADNLWLGLNSFPLWLLLEKEEKTANTDPFIHSNLSRWPGLLYRLQWPPSGDAQQDAWEWRVKLSCLLQLKKERWTMALARHRLWTIPLRFALRTTLSLLQAIATCMDFLFGRSKIEIFFDMNCLTCFSFTLLYWSMLVEKQALNRCIVGRWTPMISWVLRTPSDPLPLPQYSKQAQFIGHYAASAKPCSLLGLAA